MSPILLPAIPFNPFMDGQSEGIFQDAAALQNMLFKQQATGPGDIKFKDLNGDGKIDNNDRTYLGSFIPKFHLLIQSWVRTIKISDWSYFSRECRVIKYTMHCGQRTEGMVRFFNAGTRVLDAWTPSNTNTDVPRAISSDPNQNARPSNRFLEDGSYLRLKNIMLSYTYSRINPYIYDKRSC